MNRTDLALECAEESGKDIEGVTKTYRKTEKTKTTVIEVIKLSGAEVLGKPVGKYITVETENFSLPNERIDDRLYELIRCIRELLPAKCNRVLAAGVGNPDITSDALGPFFASSVFATRHIGDSLKKQVGLSENLCSVSSVSTGVLGQTGIESAEYIKFLCDGIMPDCVITVDALCARRLSRLGSTVQLCNTGIAPGSGVGNRRKEISEKVLGVPVVAIGVPTVVSAFTLAGDLLGFSLEGEKRKADFFQTEDLTVCTKDIDITVKNAAFTLALAVNCAVQPTLSPEEVLSFMG